MIPPIPVQDISKAAPERLILPPLDSTAIDMRRMGVPLVARVPHSEPVGIAQRRGQVNVLYSLRVRGLEMVEAVEPRARGEHVWVCSSAHLGLSPTG